MSNADKVKPDVTIELAGKSRKLIFNFGTLALIEKELGTNTFSNEFWNNISANAVITILWAGLKKADPEITQEEIGESLNLSEISPIMAKIKEAMGLAQPKATGSKGSDKAGGK
jgi:hypothetical protein